LIAGVLIISIFHIVYSKLVSNSNINFESYKVLDLNLYSAVGYVSVIMLLMLPVAFISKTYQVYGKIGAVKSVLSVLIPVSIIAAILHREPVSIMALSFLWTCLMILIRFSQLKKNREAEFFGSFISDHWHLLTCGNYSLFGEENK